MDVKERRTLVKQCNPEDIGGEWLAMPFFAQGYEGHFPGGKVVGQGRLELPTSRLSVVRSSQLSYRPFCQFSEVSQQGSESEFRPLPSDFCQMVEARRLELLTSCLQSRRSTN